MNDEQYRDSLTHSFISIISHETQTPLAIINESLLLLQDEVVGQLTDEQRRMVDIADHNTQRLSVVINAISYWTNLINHEITLHKDPLDIYEILREVANQQRHYSDI